jgi:hypothetical protein
MYMIYLLIAFNGGFHSAPITNAQTYPTLTACQTALAALQPKPLPAGSRPPARQTTLQCQPVTP